MRSESRSGMDYLPNSHGNLHDIYNEFEEIGTEIVVCRSTNMSGISTKICVLYGALLVTMEVIRILVFDSANFLPDSRLRWSTDTVGICILLLAVTVTTVLYFNIKSESLLVLPEVGICVKAVNSLGKVTSRFFDRSQIKDVVIVEAISMQCVTSYFAVRMKTDNGTQDKLCPVFMSSRHTLEELASIYRHVQHSLFYNRERDIR